MRTSVAPGPHRSKGFGGSPANERSVPGKTDRGSERLFATLVLAAVLTSFDRLSKAMTRADPRHHLLRGFLLTLGRRMSDSVIGLEATLAVGIEFVHGFLRVSVPDPLRRRDQRLRRLPRLMCCAPASLRSTRT